MRQIILIPVVAGLMACGKPKAEVTCTPSNDNLSCHVQHLSGSAAEVCWTYEGTCDNGAVITASACQKVMDGEGVGRTFFWDKMPGNAECDRLASSRISQMSVK